MSAVIPNIGLSAVCEAAVLNTLRISRAQCALHAPPKNHSGVNAVRRGMTSPAAVILVRRAEKNMRAPRAWEKSEA
jgi:hypothetical protein